MRTQTFASAFMAAAATRVAAQDDEPVTGELGDAQVVEGNPPGLVYQAVLPDEPWSEIDVEGNVKGSITAQSAPDGVGVEYTVRFSNLPKNGPFSYHIHVAPVPEDGNCTKTLAHLDPYIRTGDPPCDSEKPETCEVGDLSGKYGLIESSEDPYEATYIDPYSSLIEGQGAFFGNRSFVLHLAEDLTRISCANFELKHEGTTPTYPDDDEDCSVGESEPIYSEPAVEVPDYEKPEEQTEDGQEGCDGKCQTGEEEQPQEQDNQPPQEKPVEEGQDGQDHYGEEEEHYDDGEGDEPAHDEPSHDEPPYEVPAPEEELPAVSESVLVPGAPAPTEGVQPPSGDGQDEQPVEAGAMARAVPFALIGAAALLAI